RAERLAFGDGRDPEPLRAAIVEDARDEREPVAVRVRLHDPQHRVAAAGDPGQLREVVGERAPVDLRDGGPRLTRMLHERPGGNETAGLSNEVEVVKAQRSG